MSRRATTLEIKARTPNLVACDGLSSRNIPSRVIGDHTGWPYMACDEELTMMPRKLTVLKPSGTARSWGHSASLGFLARDAKSGAFLYSDGQAGH